jgi:hypothetical protein
VGKKVSDSVVEAQQPAQQADSKQTASRQQADSKQAASRQQADSKLTASRLQAGSKQRNKQTAKV